jgi:hypothetical protein
MKTKTAHRNKLSDRKFFVYGNLSIANLDLCAVSTLLKVHCDDHVVYSVPSRHSIFRPRAPRCGIGGDLQCGVSMHGRARRLFCRALASALPVALRQLE